MTSLARRTALLCAIILAPAPEAQAQTADGGRLALFEFDLLNTSLEPTRDDETVRLATLAPLARKDFADHGYEIIDTARVEEAVAGRRPLRDCNGCELKLAGTLGAELVAIGWVQKVSNLILNINLQMREVATGKLVGGDSVDIRGNTDESWRRGVRYLVLRRFLKDNTTPAR